MATTINPSDIPMSALIRQAKDVLAGRVAVQPIGSLMLPNRKLLAGDEEEDKGYWALLNLQALYGGQPTVCYTTPDGDLAVLASGDDEVRDVLAGLSDDERGRVVVKFPDPVAELSPVTADDGTIPTRVTPTTAATSARAG